MRAEHFITCKVSEGAYEQLMRYAASVGLTSDDIAGKIVESAMLHFSAGELSGIEKARSIINEK